MILRVRFLQNLRAGAQSVVGAVTGDPSGPRTGSVLASTAVLAPPTAPPMELGSPWVTSELANVLVDVLGADQLPLTREVAMQVPAIAKARHTVCPTLARIPFQLDGSSDAEALAFIRQPDPSMPGFLTYVWTLDDQLFHGVSWWQTLTRYANSNRPKTSRRILPGGVKQEDGGRWTVYGQPTNPADLIRLDGPHEGLLNFAAVTIRQAADIESAAAKHAKNPIPSTELHQTSGVTLPKPERTELVQEWAAARRGENGGVAYTSPNIELKTHGQLPEQLLVSGRNAAAVDVARHAGLPADALDAVPEKSTLTYNTAETKMRALIDFGLAAYGSALTARLSMDDLTPRGARVVLDYDSVTAVTDDDPSTPAPSSSAHPADGGAGPNGKA